MFSSRQSSFAFLMCCLLVGIAWAAPQQGSAAGSDTPAAQFSQAQLEQLVAPIAAYPDSLLSQILMASTYPLEVVQAARWAKSNRGLKGEQLQSALDRQAWDPSVKSLVFFPDVLDRMNENLDWTQDLGNALLSQEADVMAAVQRLRHKAVQAGNLKSTSQQKVVVEKDVIEVVPADPEVVYVPAYDPVVFYGPTWSYPSWDYPAVMVPPPGYVATASLLSFGAGVAVGACMFGAFNWGGGNVYINNNVINNFYHGPYGPYGPGPHPPGPPGPHPPGPPGPHPPGPPGPHPPGPPPGSQTWAHDPGHRGSVPYQNAAIAQKYGQQPRPAQGAGEGRTPGTGGLQGPGAGRGGAPQGPASFQGPGGSRGQGPGAFQGSGADRSQLPPSSSFGGGKDFKGFDKPAGAQGVPDSFARGGERPSPPSSFSGEGGRSAAFDQPRNAFHQSGGGDMERAFSSRGNFSRGGGGGFGGGGFGGGGGGFGHRR